MDDLKTKQMDLGKSENIQRINDEARKQMEPGDSLYGWSLISYDDGTLDLGSQGYVRDPKDLDHRTDFIVTGRMTKDSQYIQNEAAFEEGAVFSDNEPWQIEDLEDALEEAGEVGKIREIYPEFRPEQYDSSIMYPMIPKECITSADVVLDDPKYAEQYRLFQIPSDPDTDGDSYIKGGIMIPVDELHEDPKTGDYLMVEDESRSFDRVSFDRDGNVMPDEGLDATIWDIHMYTHGYQSDQYYDNLKNALESEKEDMKSYEKQEEQNSMKRIDEDRYDVSDIIQNAANKAVENANDYFDSSHTGNVENHDNVKYLDEQIYPWDLGNRYDDGFNFDENDDVIEDTNSTAQVKKIDGDRYDVSDIIRAAADKAVGDAGKADYSGYYDDSRTGPAKHNDNVKYLDEQIDPKDLSRKPAYEHMKVPAGLVKGPFEKTNPKTGKSAKYDIVYIPLDDKSKQWGKMKVADQLVQRGKTDRSPVVLALDPDKPRTVETGLAGNGKPQYAHMSAADIHQKFDENWKRYNLQNAADRYRIEVKDTPVDESETSAENPRQIKKMVEDVHNIYRQRQEQFFKNEYTDMMKTPEGRREVEKIAKEGRTDAKQTAGLEATEPSYDGGHRDVPDHFKEIYDKSEQQAQASDDRQIDGE